MLRLSSTSGDNSTSERFDAATLTGSRAAAGANGMAAAVFQMPLHYPRYTRVEYESMPEWKLDCLLAQYGLHVGGDVEHKRKFAMGAFLWT
ncbi:Unknown protein [Striga hermonthica]|uniref:DUF7722 domain-containing protein n=1 Tax=Striga hermonthica TaxID=68872 RepID=A0A9N7MVL0_STRHE|nr:Unknown protein [Striga hermonthica]